MSWIQCIRFESCKVKVEMRDVLYKVQVEVHELILVSSAMCFNHLDKFCHNHIMQI